VDWEKGNLDVLLRASDAILSLSSFQPLRYRVCYRMAKRFLVEKEYGKAVEWVRKVNVDDLDNDGKRWLAFVELKGVRGLEDWAGLERSANMWLAEFPMDANILRFKARALINRGFEKEALELYEQRILAVEPTWYALHEAGQILWKAGDLPRALCFFVAAWQRKGKAEMKVRLLDDLCDLLVDMGDSGAAQGFSVMAYRIRERNGWKQHSTGRFPEGGDARELSEGEIIDLAMRYGGWQSGTIVRVFPGGKSGLVESRGSRYYIHERSGLNRKFHLREGDAIRFVVMPGYDKRKDKFLDQVAFAAYPTGGMV